MSLVRYNPNRWFESPFDRLFPDFFPAYAGATELARHGAFVPKVDIHNDAEGITLTAEIPGVDKDSLKIEVKEGALVLSGEKRTEQEDQEDGVYRRERSYGAFQRNFNLPDEVNTEAITASQDNGVLKVFLPKKPEAKPRQIAIGNGKSEAKQIDVG